MVDWKSFREETDGSATIESVLWLPFFVFFLVLIADTSFIFHNQAQITRVVQDANRALSVGRLSSTDEAETYIGTALANVSNQVEASSVIENGIISTSVKVPVDDLVAVGFFDFLAGYDVEVTAEHFVEY
jgi:Flp pilus assembly protein TadG